MDANQESIKLAKVLADNQEKNENWDEFIKKYENQLKLDLIQSHNGNWLKLGVELSRVNWWVESRLDQFGPDWVWITTCNKHKMDGVLKWMEPY